MPTEYNILETMREYYMADINKHALAIEIILKNPMALQDHDAFYEAVESQLRQLMESKDYLDGLDIVKQIMEDNDEDI